MTENQVLKILFIDDMPEDLELAKRIISRCKIPFESYMAQNEDEFLKGLYEFKPDIIFSDHLLPEFDGMRALKISLTYNNTIPFIILTGAMNEEIAVDAMKAGATDYILKEHISRLPFVIKEAIRKKKILLENKQGRKSLELTSEILEHYPFSIISTDMEGIIINWNKGAEKIFGYTSREALGQHISLIYSDSDLENLNSDIIKPLLEKGDHQEQVRLKRKNGELFISSLSLRIIKDKNGQACGMAGYTLDITKTVKAEEELFIRNQAIESSVDGIVLLDLEGRITYTNKAALEIWGYGTKDDVIGKCAEDLFYTDYERTEILEILKDQGFKSERKARRKDGSMVSVWLSTTIIKDIAGKPIAYMGSFMDITERKKAEEELEESEERLRLAMKVSEHGFWAWDLQNDKFYFNLSLLGYNEKKFPMGLDTLSSLMHPQDRNNIMPEIIRSAKESKPFNYEIRMLSSSGEWKWVLAKGNTFDAKVGTRRTIGTLVDITDRKITEEQMFLARLAAEEANRCKNELLANMNHELRTPLNSVIGYSDVLIEQNMGELNDEQKKYLQIVNDAGHTLLELINRVLDLAIMESNGMELRFSAFDPVKSIEEVIKSTKMMTLKKNIMISVNIHQNVVEITADADKFKEILYNLIENAVKFTPSRGTITIDAEIKDEHIVVSVEDNGIGIAENDKEKIFNSFVQVDSSNTRRFGGAGLGLALVRECLKLQSGNIQLESDLGKGSKFTFRIPVYPKGRGTDIY
ncbi:hybrid sensor histidine kinase/response regulator [Methanolobus psychrotolerans]|uniref:hybrid sensor histidine kinase/response regulator n=1 Tax=Methanolobus psychrotolerans TaxID=1874706 RepID=UPI000B91695C|nr:PAS domain S-box protein [Methanolobus psychrotolerans]